MTDAPAQIAERGFARLRDFEAIAKQFPSLFLHMNTLQREVRERVMGIEWWRRHLQEGGGASNVAAASSVVQTDDAHSVVRRKAKRSKMVTDMRRSMAAQSGPASPLLTAKSQRLLLHRQASASLRDDPPTAGERSTARTSSHTRGAASRPPSGGTPLAPPSRPPGSSSRGTSRHRGGRLPPQLPRGTSLRALEPGQAPGGQGSRTPASESSPPQSRSRPATGQSGAGGAVAGPAGWGKQALENMGIDPGHLSPRTRRATEEQPREQSAQGRLLRSRNFERAVRTQTAHSRRRTATPPAPYAAALVTRPRQRGGAEPVIRAGRGLVPIYLASLPRTRAWEPWPPAQVPRRLYPPPAQAGPSPQKSCRSCRSRRARVGCLDGAVWRRRRGRRQRGSCGSCSGQRRRATWPARWACRRKGRAGGKERTWPCLARSPA